MQMELVPYSETRRDRLEQQLAADADKRELMARRDHGIEVFLYWLKSKNVLSIEVTDIQAQETHSFVVPSDKGLDAHAHPYFYLYRAGIKPKGEDNAT